MMMMRRRRIGNDSPQKDKRNISVGVYFSTGL
jgi:hypothetical protein